jgi:hypothetical protein
VDGKALTSALPSRLCHLEYVQAALKGPSLLKKAAANGRKTFDLGRLYHPKHTQLVLNGLYLLKKIIEIFRFWLNAFCNELMKSKAHFAFEKRRVAFCGNR